MVSNILVFALIVGTNAITWSTELPKKPEEFANLTGCYIKEIHDVIPFSDTVNALGFCYIIHCTITQIDYISCGVTSDVNDNCHITEAQFDEPFPKCCPMVKCYDEDIPWVKNTTNNEILIN
ncbi:hypothetical protein PYW07_012407 [Mythimna separata]|uniref:Single domain-containing protein n=1 Tax=Mythimna separata TaxID=271217 RepID=A0AAD7YMY1_MYTSE|nr:hypothetical protein PYW07_012407 [Mythimna separata]